jgi:hypothetical protein
MRSLALLLCAWSTSALTATSWEVYLELPTPENAARVQALEYTAPVEGGYNADDLRLLEAQVRAADAQAFRLAYRLYIKADGGRAEELGVMLGEVTRAHPIFFLREVSALKIQCSSLKWPLNAPGLEYVDRLSAQAYEIAQRRKALESVTDNNLVTVRNQCLKQFERP